jgi:hypothetical protein
MYSGRSRYGSAEQGRRGVMVYQGWSGGSYPPVKTISVTRGKSRAAVRREMGLSTGISNPPKGFPPQPIGG